MVTKLTPELVLKAYAQGYFPMPHPISGDMCWFQPDPRAILPLEGFHLSRSLRRTLRHVPFRVSMDTQFREVLDGCADREETWINDEIQRVFLELHHRGYAHSLEVWLEDKLVGGTYGLALGSAFFAESKFHRVPDASKVAIFLLTEHLRQQGFHLLEVQFLTPHLQSLGVIEVGAATYEKLLDAACRQPCDFAPLRGPLDLPSFLKRKI